MMYLAGFTCQQTYEKKWHKRCVFSGLAILTAINSFTEPKLPVHWKWDPRLRARSTSAWKITTPQNRKPLKNEERNITRLHPWDWYI